MLSNEILNHPSLVLCQQVIEERNPGGMQIMIDLASKHSIQARDDMDKFFRDNVVSHLNSAYRNNKVLAEIHKYMDSYNRILNGETTEISSYQWRFNR
jgi:hypothetical protein